MASTLSDGRLMQRALKSPLHQSLFSEIQAATEKQSQFLIMIRCFRHLNVT